MEEVVAEPIADEILIPCEATVEDEFVAGEIMVGIKSTHSVVNKVWTAADFPEILGITSIEDLTYADTEQAVAKFSAKDNFHQLLKISISNTTKAAVIAGIDALEQNDKILFAEPNSIFKMEQPVEETNPGIALANAVALNNSGRYKKFTNDPYLEDQHGIFLHNVDKVWNAFTKGSSSVTVGVIDSGISQHEDIEANLVSPGYNAVNGGNDYSYTHLTTHGTEVASIIGAVGNNQKGMSGVCQNVSIKSYMVASGIRENGQAYAYVEDISSAVLRAYMDDIDILNISWEVDTSDDTDSANLNMVCDMFEGLIVIAAGNDHSEIVASNT